MSGFFMLHRPAFERVMRQLSGHDFKILLDLFTSTPTPYRFKELPYVFGERLRGESKLDGLVVWEYLMLLLSRSAAGRPFASRCLPWSAELASSSILRRFGWH
jgi:dolichol-phosphate mannosyltransferase